MSKTNYPTIPCKFCDTKTPMLGTQMCDGCWEVEKRLADFLRHPNARRFALKLLAKHSTEVHLLVRPSGGVQSAYLDRDAAVEESCAAGGSKFGWHVEEVPLNSFD